MNGNFRGSPTDKTKTVRNILLAVVAIALSTVIFLGNTSSNNSTSLEAQAQQSVALETALTNGKPTLIEFYANWCTSCQSMAPDLAVIKQQYADAIDFVMLNVDNPKWLPEVLRYRVDGIPHFVFVNAQGEAIAQSIGEQPPTVMQSNLDALIANLPLPNSQSIGQVSQFTAPVSNSKTDVSDPRSHGQ
ncbi:thioredoxin family protein [Gloeocapsa sp. PCC 73106]|uniref:thioredoxin family protein n=1 Tax=Gloeocapsa sp. PCC 73106 TaxID=102232 RepID=UPI0002AC1187|nr:thioredoxin family protein [Gloeocapsa sp. PCC 73106]ELR99725.1 thiol-disulfide isomerase-like thioredoxin [Gloeocapsa sp. PCC 73106]